MSEMPAGVRSALDAVWAGATADSMESAVLDFKEDPARAAGASGGNPDARVVEMLLDEAVCLANGDGVRLTSSLGLRTGLEASLRSPARRGFLK
jgi:hypothetical protein